ncbi:hypothetical protein BVH03_15310 [Pseudomonas sp. PA15(2017)]|uniref:hypothetical protein n=1 Tax=Pseudomonas sp. PA15(2017) TaxID=1932111 RepID=UPI0009651288|nr:hypothetical protein [Pseudomonas sp. PA15(2017)]OLU26963.1 hypothetical protein BVH03_15310 [Pseudomonas sp. PA15(2017)]
MTLVKFDADPAEADLMRMHYGEKTASKAYAKAATDALQLYRETQHLQETIEMQRIEILRYQRILEQARASAMHLVEACGQGDLLNG